jgi:hypothetical protein
LVPLQLSVAVTPPNTSGTIAWQLPSALALAGAGQLTVGTVVSVTVNVVVHVAVLPVASVAVTVMVCAPNPTSVPAAGICVTVIALVAVQLSLTVTPAATLGTAARQLVSALALEGAGQITVGFTGSWTVTVAVQVAVLPLLSVTVRITVFVPRLVQSKLVLFRLRLAMPQASVLPLSIWAAEIVATPVLSS